MAKSSRDSEADEETLSEEEEDTEEEKLEVKTAGGNVSDRTLFSVYRAVQDEIVYELAAVMDNVGLENMGVLIDALRKYMFAPLFPQEEVIGPGVNATALQRSLGKLLSDGGSQKWIAWFLAFPVNRDHPDGLKAFRAALSTPILHETDADDKRKQVASFFREAKNYKSLDNPLKRAIDSHFELYKSKLPEEATKYSEVIQFAILVNTASRFVLTQSMYCLPRIGTDANLEITKDTVVPALTYAVTPFALGFAYRFLVGSGKSGLEHLASATDKDGYGHFALPDDWKNEDKIYGWTCLPWRTTVAVMQMITLKIQIIEEQDKKAYVGEVRNIYSNFTGSGYGRREDSKKNITRYIRVNPDLNDVIKEKDITIGSLRS